MTFRTYRLLTSMLPLLALPAIAHAQTTIALPVAASGQAVAIPAAPKRIGTPVVIAAVIDTTGNADTAKKALSLAARAVNEMPGYTPMAPSEYAALGQSATKTGIAAADWGWPFTGSDFQKIGKTTKAPCAMTLTLTPEGDGYSVIAEMYDTKIGALTGYGRGTSAAGSQGDVALSSAVASAVQDLSKTAVLSGIVISKPSVGGLYVARLSLGTLSGARAGSRVEYLDDNGEAIGFGTLFDIAGGEGLASVAPETVYPQVFVNQRVRLVNNPITKRAMATSAELQNKEFEDFSKSFALSAGVAAAVYYLVLN